MSFEFKERKHLDVVNKIKMRVLEIQEKSRGIDEICSALAFMTMVNDHYIQENMLDITKESDGATEEHLNEVLEFLTEYDKQLNEAGMILGQMSANIVQHFDYEEESIKNTVAKLRRYL